MSLVSIHSILPRRYPVVLFIWILRSRQLSSQFISIATPPPIPNFLHLGVRHFRGRHFLSSQILHFHQKSILLTLILDFLLQIHRRSYFPNCFGFIHLTGLNYRTLKSHLSRSCH